MDTILLAILRGVTLLPAKVIEVLFRIKNSRILRYICGISGGEIEDNQSITRATQLLCQWHSTVTLVISELDIIAGSHYHWWIRHIWICNADGLSKNFAESLVDTDHVVTLRYIGARYRVDFGPLRFYSLRNVCKECLYERAYTQIKLSK